MSLGMTLNLFEEASNVTATATATQAGNKRKLSEALGFSPSLTTALLVRGMSSQNKRQMASISCSNSLTPATVTAPATTAVSESPADFVVRVFQEQGLDPATLCVPFVTPTEEMIAAYRHETLKAARAGDVTQLRQIQQSGVSLDCCNRFGESLIHLACRRGNLELVRFLVLEAKVTLLIRDDYHRTLLHDSFWTPQPQFDLVDFLLDHVPELLCVKDVRGHAPVDYVRHEHKAVWLNFFKQRQDKLCPKPLVVAVASQTTTSAAPSVMGASSYAIHT